MWRTRLQHAVFCPCAPRHAAAASDLLTEACLGAALGHACPAARTGAAGAVQLAWWSACRGQALAQTAAWQAPAATASSLSCKGAQPRPELSQVTHAPCAAISRASSQHMCICRAGTWHRRHLSALMGLSLAAAALLLGVVAAVGPLRQQGSASGTRRQSMVISMSAQSMQQDRQWWHQDADEQSGWQLGSTTMPSEGRIGQLEYLQQADSSSATPDLTDPVARYLYKQASLAGSVPPCARRASLTSWLLLQNSSAPELEALQWFRGRDLRQLWNHSVVSAAENWRLGSHSGLCESVAPANASTLAIVGNGPLTQEQRRQIAGMDRVVRFNAANNM